MNTQTSVLLFSVFTFPLLIIASKMEDLEINKLQAPPEIISPAGRNRIRDHIATIKENITHTETNLLATKKNIDVIESELKDLNELEKEHLRLRERYVDFLNHASKESIKNEKALREIDEFRLKAEKLIKAHQNDTQLNELQTATLEKNEREAWARDANQKTKRIQELLLGVEKNLKSIAGRKQPLLEQLESWKTKKTEYTQLLSKLNDKKTVAERYLATQTK